MLRCWNFWNLKGRVPATIGDGIENHTNYVTQRCSDLTDVGLIQRVARGVYQITEDGVAYLEGELDASELELTEE